MNNPRKSICELCNQEYWNTVPYIVEEHKNIQSATHILGKLNQEQRKTVSGLGCVTEDGTEISGGDIAESVFSGGSNCELCDEKVKPSERVWTAKVGNGDGDYQYWCFECLPESAEKYSLEAISKIIEMNELFLHS